MAPGVSRCSRRRRAAPLDHGYHLWTARRSRCLLRGRVIERDPVSAQGSIFSARQRGIDSAPPRRRLPCRRAVCVTKQKGHARARRALGAAAGTRQRSRHPTHSGKQPCTRFRTRLRGRGVLERRAQGTMASSKALSRPHKGRTKAFPTAMRADDLRGSPERKLFKGSRVPELSGRIHF